MTLRDHLHTYHDDSEVCSHCGQPIVYRTAPSWGRKGPNRLGVAGTIGLHLLLIAIWLWQPDQDPEKRARPAPGRESEVVYVAPLQEPAPREQAPRPITSLPAPPIPRVEQERIIVERLPDTITIPDERPPTPPAPTPPRPQPAQAPQETDMMAAIEARRKQRGAPTGSETQQPESEAARGTRNALANIAAINNRGSDDSNESGGIFSITNKTFNTMDLKFRGWNPSFKRRWLTAVTVEQGSERDIETAVVKKMIELIRREKKGDFEWDSHRLGRVVTLSARPQDTDQLIAFLYKEMFPEYRPVPGR